VAGANSDPRMKTFIITEDQVKLILEILELDMKEQIKEILLKVIKEEQKPNDYIEM
jgi:hypothetical protein